ncbi:hypothetical protein ACXO8N_00530 [Lactobacillus delbrueckii subsp. bulgaricus]|uniref:hypothetical protein n=1 Tax=Lactobacillus delbrueckii TaxID=1584 RepID=UPI001E5BD81F|nr:hypothetical protein [Lactobacillus delbrueckii]MDA3848724.1 hypothetical protein [Lactobacillus delbrueckii]
MPFVFTSLRQAYFSTYPRYLAAAEYPESIDFASSFNSIFANVGISLGSFTAAQAAGLTGIASTPYFGGLQFAQLPSDAPGLSAIGC